MMRFFLVVMLVFCFVPMINAAGGAIDIQNNAPVTVLRDACEHGVCMVSAGVQNQGEAGATGGVEFKIDKASNYTAFASLHPNLGPYSYEIWAWSKSGPGDVDAALLESVREHFKALGLTVKEITLPIKYHEKKQGFFSSDRHLFSVFAHGEKP